MSCFEFEFARRRSNSINLFSLHCADRPLAAVVLFFGPMDTIEEEETLTDAADAVEEEGTTQPFQPSRSVYKPVHEQFTCVSMLPQTFKCNFCEWRTRSTSTRRKLEHLMAVGGASKACKHAADKLDPDLFVELKLLLKGMNQEKADAKRRKSQRRKAASSVSLPQWKRQKRISAFLSQAEKDKIDMAYARKVIMTASKSGYMESDFTFSFFEVSPPEPPCFPASFCCVQECFNYTPPSRKVVMGALLDELYNDCRKKVATLMNFDDPDSLVTISMDGWKAPTGEHIRNYMWVTDKFTFFYTATNAGADRPTGENIGKECLDIIEATGPENVAAVANDNATAETTSWDTIRDDYPRNLCTGKYPYLLDHLPHCLMCRLQHPQRFSPIQGRLQAQLGPAPHREGHLPRAVLQGPPVHLLGGAPTVNRGAQKALLHHRLQRDPLRRRLLPHQAPSVPPDDSQGDRGV